MFRESHVDNQFSLKSSFFWMKEEYRQILANGWAGCFRRNITEKIDELPYAALYSALPSRPNAPVRVQIGMMLLEQIFRMTETEVRNGTIFDMQIQYALGIENTENIDISERTLQRFRKACLIYETTTGTDLLHNTIVALAKESADLMDIDGTKLRMDSLMIESNIKTLSRIEILYQVSQDLAFAITGISKRSAMAFAKSQSENTGQQSFIEESAESPAIIKAREIGMPECLYHLLNPYDGNVVLYHSKKSVTEKREQILSDVKALMDFSKNDYTGLSEFSLFERAVKEQCKESYMTDDEDRPYVVYVLRTKGDGMNSSILQNPSDPDATYREKEGNHRGYVANVVEASNGDDSVVIEYTYDVNTASDNDLGAKTLTDLGEQDPEAHVTVAVDGAFAGNAIEKAAQENNIELIHTNLTGKATSTCHADHTLNADQTAIEKCAGGQTPIKTSTGKDGALNATMDINICRACPFFNECHPRENKTTAVLRLTKKQIRRAIEVRSRGSAEFTKNSNFRNGVETIPSTLRRRYRIDEMPVRGLRRTRFRFGLSIGGLNFMKMWKFVKNGVSAPKNQLCIA